MQLKIHVMFAQQQLAVQISNNIECCFHCQNISSLYKTQYKQQTDRATASNSHFVMQLLSISSAIHVVTILGFLTHVLVFTYHQLFPQKTSSRLEERKLDDIEFPILFKICLNPAFDLQKLKNVGYSSLWRYFVGKSDRASRKTYGWAGINEDGTKYATVAGICYVYCLHIYLLYTQLWFFLAAKASQ